MARTLGVLAAQVRAVPFDPAATLDRFEGLVERSARSFPRAELMVFPELFLAAEDPFTDGESDDYADQVAEPITGPIMQWVGKIAARAGRWIVAGSILERDGSSIYNTAVVFSPAGDLHAVHRKTLPWRPFENTAPGPRPTVFDIPDIGRVGLMICYEGWFPEVARSLAQMGAEIIIQPSLTATPDREEELVLARANAIVNQCFVINVNAVSTMGGGRSIGVDPEGRVLFEAGTNEELIVENIDLDRVALVRERGTRSLNRLSQHFEDAPAGIFEVYRPFLEA